MTMEMELTDDLLIEEYITVAFSNGFSAGTANVTPEDMKKLRPLLQYYAKKPHPFTACVRDNRKRFGPRTEAVCAVVKDLIYHSTRWRNQKKGNGPKAQFSQDEVASYVLEDAIPDEFFAWLSEMSEDELEEWAALSQGDPYVDDHEIEDEEEQMAVLSEDLLLAEMYFDDGGDTEESDGLVWKPILREGKWMMSPVAGGESGKKPITVVKSGKSDPDALVISMPEVLKNFKDEAIEHVQIPLSHKAGVLENTGFVKALKMRKGKDGKQELMAGLDFTEPDVKDKTKRGTIANSSAGVLFNFTRKEDGKKYAAVLDHVALTNRPWLNGLQPFGAGLADDEEVESVLFGEEGVDLDDQPIWEVRQAVDCLRRAYAAEPEDDDKASLDQALQLVLAVMAKNEQEQGSTLPGMGNSTSLQPSAGNYSDDEAGGGENVSKEDEATTAKEQGQDTFLQKLGLSEDEVQARLNRYEEMEQDAKVRSVDDRCTKWEGEKRSPAMIVEAKRILLADDGAVVVNLAQDGGKHEELTASDIVDRLVSASPKIELSTDPVNDKDLSDGGEPAKDTKEENSAANLSQEVRALASSLFMEGKVDSEEQAVAMAQKELGVETAKA